MPERVIFHAGDPEFETDDLPDRNKERIKLGRKLIIVGAATLCFAALMVVIFIVLVVGALPSHSQPCSNNCSSYVSPSQIKVTSDEFGTTHDGLAIQRYTMTNDPGMVVQVITFGARVTAIKVPDKTGQISDITLGFDTLTGYETSYFGGVIGRYANRIANSSFTLDGHVYNLTRNEGQHHLHGGIKGWDKYVWRAVVIDNGVVMSHVSSDGDEGYPGEIHVNVTYQLSNDNRLTVTYSAVTIGKPSPINLSSGIFFNLAGEGSTDIYDHSVTIYADSVLAVNTERIPTGALLPVNGTTFDLRDPHGTILRSVIRNVVDVDDIGFDRTFCLRGPAGQRLAASVHHATSGRHLTVMTNQPAVQFYTGNRLNVTDVGKSQHTYGPHSGFVLETQNYPDTINHPNFPDSVLHEGSTYIHTTSFIFSVDK